MTRLATWNVNSLRARLDRFGEWYEQAKPDIVLLQETKCDDAGFPVEAFAELGFETAHNGDGRWNGVAILSRIGLDDVSRGFTNPTVELASECRLISARCADVRVMSVYVPNGRSVDSPHYDAKLVFLHELRHELDTACSPADLVAIGGDFNVALQDRDVWDIAQFDGTTHVSAPEREALSGVLEWGLYDVVREHHPDELGPFSWWDYRGGAFHKGHGMRIDLVLLSGALSAHVTNARVDRDARKKGRDGAAASDHAPVIVDFEL